MTVNASEPRPRLTEQVAEEIRVLLTRRRMSGRELARRMGASPSWVNFRLTGAQPINLDDLQRFAEVLGVEITDLLPRPMPGRLVATAGQHPNAGSGASSVRAARKRRNPTPRPISGTRPGKPAPASTVLPTQRRPTLVSGPGKRIPA